MYFDATRMADWQIAREVENGMPTPLEWADRPGLAKGEIIPLGRVCKPSLMPGTGSNPGFRRADVDVKTGEVTGLF